METRPTKHRTTKGMSVATSCRSVRLPTDEQLQELRWWDLEQGFERGVVAHAYELALGQSV